MASVVFKTVTNMKELAEGLQKRLDVDPNSDVALTNTQALALSVLLDAASYIITQLYDENQTIIEHITTLSKVIEKRKDK